MQCQTTQSRAKISSYLPMWAIGGAAAKMVILRNRLVQPSGSDLATTHAFAGIVCRSEASRPSFIEHCQEEALAIIEENKSVLLVLAHALATHPKQTMTAVEIDAVIASAMGNQVLSLEHRRHADWRDRELPTNCFPKSLPNRSFFVSFLATNLRARHNSNFFPKKKFHQSGLFDKKL
jgi:hypothetical protein